jgi:type II secretory pathway pseudopilin PulG
LGFLRHIKRFADDQSGMTLIDMAIFMMVIGLLTVPLIKSYDGWRYSHAKGETGDKIASINKAIDDYYYDNGRYPCPALVSSTLTAVNYGKEDCTAATDLPGNVKYGMVPFVTLKLPETVALDGWSNRIGYTVAKIFLPPSAPPFPNTSTPTTNILVRIYNPSCDGTENSPKSNAHFVLVSYGPNGVGARSATGALVQACPTGAGVPLEAENCDGDLEFRDSMCARNDRQGANYYDDITYADDRIPNRIWVYSTAAANDPSDIVSTVQRVGVNNDNAFGGDTSAFGVDVIGNVLSGDGGANPGAIVSDTMCDTNGDNCFSPDLIGGAESPMNDCTKASMFNGGNSTGMRGLWGGTEATDGRSGARARCQNSFLPSTTNLCAPKYAIGFSGGKILCAP